MVVICEHRAVLRIAAVDKRARSADPHRPSAGTVDGRPVGHRPASVNPPTRWRWCFRCTGDVTRPGIERRARRAADTPARCPGAVPRYTKGARCEDKDLIRWPGRPAARGGGCSPHMYRDMIPAPARRLVRWRPRLRAPPRLCPRSSLHACRARRARLIPHRAP